MVDLKKIILILLLMRILKRFKMHPEIQTNNDRESNCHLLLHYAQKGDKDKFLDILEMYFLIIYTEFIGIILLM